MVVVRITYTDNDGTILSETIDTHSGTYGWEVVKWFDQMGEAVAKKTDPSYDG